MNTVEFEGKPLEFSGKRDEQFVNDKIRKLREKRNNLQDKIYELSNQLSQLKEENDNIQDEIDKEFLKQEHAFDLVGKYIQCANKIYFVTDVERLFEGVRILSNWYCYLEDKLVYASSKEKPLKVISFEVLEAILSRTDENNKFISKEEAMEIFNKIIKENNKRYEK